MERTSAAHRRSAPALLCPVSRGRKKNGGKTRNPTIKTSYCTYICHVRYNVTRWGLICRRSRDIARQENPAISAVRYLKYLNEKHLFFLDRLCVYICTICVIYSVRRSQKERKERQRDNRYEVDRSARHAAH